MFPLSNWTELDIWQYIYREQIPIVPLYFAAERPVVLKDGMWVMVDDDRLPIHANEAVEIKRVRFRTLGCYPLTGAVESNADDLSSIVLELLNSRTSERQGRAIDSDSSVDGEEKAGGLFLVNNKEMSTSEEVNDYLRQQNQLTFCDSLPAVV